MTAPPPAAKSSMPVSVKPALRLQVPANLAPMPAAAPALCSPTSTTLKASRSACRWSTPARSAAATAALPWRRMAPTAIASTRPIPASTPWRQANRSTTSSPSTLLTSAALREASSCACGSMAATTPPSSQWPPAVLIAPAAPKPTRA